MSAPLLSPPIPVEPGWIDINGHVNMGYYAVMVDRAGDAALDALGLTAARIRDTGASVFVGRLLLDYRRELVAGDAVVGAVELIAASPRKLHARITLRHADGGWIAAQAEVLYLHVDLARRKVTEAAPDLQAAIAARLPASRPEGVADWIT